MALALIKEKAEDVFIALKSRYTCRDFRPDPLSQKTIETILESANRAPSTANTQPWEVYVAAGASLGRLRSKFLEHFEKSILPNPFFPLAHEWPAELDQRRKEIMAMNLEKAGIHTGDTTDAQKHMIRNYEFFNAPAVVYLCMDKNLGAWSVFDLGLFSQSLMLAAKAMGVDTAPALMLVGYPDLIREELNIPEHLAVVFGIAMGYGTENGRPGKWVSPRRRVDQFVRWKGF